MGAVPIILWLFMAGYAHGKCTNLCNQNGRCNIYSRCECFDGFTGADCSLRTCPYGLAWADHATAVDTAHKPAECSNKGICNRQTGRCSCSIGFTGSACQRNECSNGCSNHGKCMSMEQYASAYYDENSDQYSYSEVWDAEKLYGCVCDEGYTGHDCSERLCPTGDDPLTTGQANAVQIVKCVARGGTFVLRYRGQPSSTIKATATAREVAAAIEAIPLIDDVRVTFSNTETNNGSACGVSETNLIKVEFLQNFGPQPPLLPYTDNLSGGGGTVTVSADGDTATALSDTVGNTWASVVGTKEDDLCSNRGICGVDTGACACFSTNGDSYVTSDGYGGAGIRGDCGHPVTAPVSCPGDIPCSGHGVCDTARSGPNGGGGRGTYRCTCAEGWTGGDCADRTCPSGPPWFGYPASDNDAHRQDEVVECSNGGQCDRTTGRCLCDPGLFSGAACEYMQCFTSEREASPGSVCHGHGRCVSMRELATYSTTSLGDTTAYTYGVVTPNSPLTWDSSRVFGCMCDAGYGGHDCRLRTCPTGDDPATYDQSNEIQLWQCTATSGFVDLTFRGASFSDADLSNFGGSGSTGPGFGGKSKTVTSSSSYSSASVAYTRRGEQSMTRTNRDTVVKTDAITGGESLLQYNATVWEVRDALEALSTIDRIAITFISATNGKTLAYSQAKQGTGRDPSAALCTSDGSTVVKVEFRTEHGDLPAIAIDTTYLVDDGNGGTDGSGTFTAATGGDSITLSDSGSTVVTSVDGTTEDDVCSNHGLCNELTGVCRCFDGWASSDGMGGAGPRNDCGYRIPQRASVRGATVDRLQRAEQQLLSGLATA